LLVTRGSRLDPQAVVQVSKSNNFLRNKTIAGNNPIPQGINPP
jgi:hypothetical protein